MKISRPDGARTSAVGRRSKTGSRSSSEADFSVGGASSADEASPVTGAGPVASVGGLLSVQEVSDATSEESRGLRRGYDLLDILDSIRLGLLTGSIPESQLQRLVQNLKQRREITLDPVLERTIREIEVRAAVELAKFDRIRSVE